MTSENIKLKVWEYLCHQST